ncbi:MAG: hypothetical protein CMF62_02320 [Magnetococcales bacterium]|nr:hypothetical protein [Magnetococcales bacterium]|tara:strand:+ start:6611 stop:7306 length:696 start_codon:yes stop_codon:yes gene_type:complete
MDILKISKLKKFLLRYSNKHINHENSLVTDLCELYKKKDIELILSLDEFLVILDDLHIILRQPFKYYTNTFSSDALQYMIKHEQLNKIIFDQNIDSNTKDKYIYEFEIFKNKNFKAYYELESYNCWRRIPHSIIKEIFYGIRFTNKFSKPFELFNYIIVNIETPNLVENIKDQFLKIPQCFVIKINNPNKIKLKLESKTKFLELETKYSSFYDDYKLKYHNDNFIIYETNY